MSSGTAARERDKELSLVQHLGELRDRLMFTAVALVATTAIAFSSRVTDNLLRVGVNYKFNPDIAWLYD